MKITHICLCGPVTDNFSYQDNLLPKYHKKNGYEVSVITSQYIWNDKGNIVVDNKSTYYNEHGIKTIRLKSKYGTTVNSKLKKYKDLYNTISMENPDVLFVHGIQFLDIRDVVKYVKKNRSVKVFVDNHADYSNSATTEISRLILHGIIWRYCGKIIEPYTSKFYGVLPARVDFLKDVYKIPSEKVELLVLGADDEKVNESKKMDRNELRKKFNIKPDDFLVITGGKIDSSKKQTLLLIQAIKNIKKSNIKLLIFGSVADEIIDEFNTLVDGEKIIYIGWISSDESYSYFASSDLAVFPGRHSVLWEQAIGTGVPCVFKHWEGTTHVDVGGNCKFLYDDTVDELEECIKDIINDKSLYMRMKESTELYGMKVFSYENIAKRSVLINNSSPRNGSR